MDGEGGDGEVRGGVGRLGRAVLDHGGIRSGGGRPGWLFGEVKCQKLVRELAPGRRGLMNWGRSGGTGVRGWTHPIVVVVVVVSLFDLGLLLRIDRNGSGERQRRRSALGTGRRAKKAAGIPRGERRRR